MEKSALIYVFLTFGCAALGLLVRNEAYVRTGHRGGRTYGKYAPVNREQARNLVAEFAIYCLLAGVSACRIATGHDYWVYRENFKIIAQDRHVSSEIGFNLTVKVLIALFGYDNYLPIFGFFSVITVFLFVKALHDQGRHYAFSVFLFMTCGYYFYSMNSVRYYLALAAALFSMKYVLRREYGKFLLVILLAAFFHKTVLLVIPAYLVAEYLARGGIKKWHCVVMALFLVSLVFGQRFYRFIIFKIYPYYENSHFDVGRLSYANLAKCLGTLALAGLAWFFAGKDKGEKSQGRGPCADTEREEEICMRFYLLLTAFGVVAFCCGGFVPEVTRIGYYLIIPQIFLIPELVYKVKRGLLFELCKWGTILAFSGYFILILRKMYEADVRILPYLNWIFN